MARRVDRALDQDPFAAALLAREYLGRVPELRVNPLEQQGRTDAWTSAFVRLRVAANALDKHPSRAEGERYLAARAEERRLHGLLGRAPKTRLTEARNTARRARQADRTSRVGAVVALALGAVAVGVGALLGRLTLGLGAAAACALLAAFAWGVGRASGRAAVASSHRATEIERAMAALAVFERADEGRALVQRIEREHPLLLSGLGDR